MDSAACRLTTHLGPPAEAHPQGLVACISCSMPRLAPAAQCPHLIKDVWWVSLRYELLAQLRPTLKFVSASLSKSRNHK